VYAVWNAPYRTQLWWLHETPFQRSMISVLAPVEPIGQAEHNNVQLPSGPTDSVPAPMPRLVARSAWQSHLETIYALFRGGFRQDRIEY